MEKGWREGKEPKEPHWSALDPPVKRWPRYKFNLAVLISIFLSIIIMIIISGGCAHITIINILSLGMIFIIFIYDYYMNPSMS